MDWDINIIEQEILVTEYFRNVGLELVEKHMRDPGTSLEAFECRLANTNGRGVEITFAPPRSKDRPAVSQVYIVDITSDKQFNIKALLRQKYKVNLTTGFKFTDYKGDFRDRVHGFLEFASSLLKKYTEPILEGKEWPDVHFDWGGTR